MRAIERMKRGRKKGGQMPEKMYRGRCIENRNTCIANRVRRIE